MKKKVEIQQQSAAEQNKMNQSLSFDGASSPNEVKIILSLCYTLRKSSISLLL